VIVEGGSAQLGGSLFCVRHGAQRFRRKGSRVGAAEGPSLQRLAAVDPDISRVGRGQAARGRRL
jgi:hypothetical protein